MSEIPAQAVPATISTGDPVVANPLSAETLGAFAAVLVGVHAIGEERHLIEGHAGVVLSPVPDCAILNLRATAGNGRAIAALTAAVQDQIGITLPTAVYGSASDADARIRALWTGPGDWLITCPETGLNATEAALREALAGASGALTDVSHGYAVLNLSGPDARAVLAQGCGLDLHPAVFPEGHCAMTGLARMRVLIDHLPLSAPRGGSFDVYVARSYAASLWHFATTAAGEFGYRVRIMGTRGK